MSSEYSRRISSFFSKLKDSKVISKPNKEHIQEFYSFALEKGIGEGRRKNLLMESIYWAKLLGKDFKRADKKDTL